jgi:hypothetical protein
MARGARRSRLESFAGAAAAVALQPGRRGRRRERNRASGRGWRRSRPCSRRARSLRSPYGARRSRPGASTRRAAALHQGKLGCAAGAGPGEGGAAVSVLRRLRWLFLATSRLFTSGAGQDRDSARRPDSDRRPRAGDTSAHDALSPALCLPESHPRADDGGRGGIPPPALPQALRSGSLPGAGARSRAGPGPHVAPGCDPPRSFRTRACRHGGP